MQFILGIKWQLDLLWAYKGALRRTVFLSYYSYYFVLGMVASIFVFVARLESTSVVWNEKQNKVVSQYFFMTSYVPDTF